MDLLDSYRRTSDEHFKQEVVLRFAEADAIASRIGYIFSDKKKRRSENIVQPWTVFPDLFAQEDRREDGTEEEVRAQVDPALELHKQRMEKFAARWNAKHNGG